ncbi:MAG: ankyrin repeat domain-containing protein [Candidatus Woesearchaeota archaeon]
MAYTQEQIVINEDLIKAVLRNDEDTAAICLKNGADPDYYDAEGNTPLVWAAYHGFCGMVVILLEYGADPKLPDMTTKMTPLQLARSRYHGAVVEKLEYALAHWKGSKRKKKPITLDKKLASKEATQRKRLAKELLGLIPYRPKDKLT